MPRKRGRGSGRGVTFQDGRTGRWAYRFTTAAGRQQRGGFPTQRSAAEALDEARDDARQPGAERRRSDLLVGDLCDLFLAQYDAAPATVRKVRSHLNQLRREFKGRTVASLEPYELAAFRLKLSAGSRHSAFRTVKQVLDQARKWGWIAASPAADVRNPAGKPQPFGIFADWEWVERLETQMPTIYRGLPTFLVGTGLRPEEWLALERRDVDRAGRVVSVERTFSDWRVTPFTKTDGSRRQVPLRQRVLEALDGRVTRVDTSLLFPALKGRHVHLPTFREEVWKPGLAAAGLPQLRIYDARHSYASWAIAAGVDLFTLSRRMGTSLRQIDRTYGHLVKGAVDRELELLEAFDDATAAKGHGKGTGLT